MPPNISSPAYCESQQFVDTDLMRRSTDNITAIAITLTSVKGQPDVRTLDLKPGEPCLIGRASRTSAKNLNAGPENALYDCPVVSREHAELKTHPWDPVEKRVTITDKGSMHGTRVNGVRLAAYKPMSLRSGDIIQFGERVTRGESMFHSLNRILAFSTDPSCVDNHEGVSVAFSHRTSATQESHTMAGSSPVSRPNKGYRLRYSSDEESDYASDASNASDDYNIVEQASSAKTTPEQPKVKLGSQELPIDLASAKAKPGSQELPIYLDEPEVTSGQRATAADESIVIPESIPFVNVKKSMPLPASYESDDEEAPNEAPGGWYGNEEEDD